MERENQDLALEQIRLKAAEYRTTVLESIRYCIHIGVGSCLSLGGGGGYVLPVPPGSYDYG